MPKMLQVRNVPEDVHETLKRRAAESGMTLSSYVLRELNRLAARPTQEEVFRGAERHGASFTLEAAAADIRALRDERSQHE
jgi:plasmid stability protein